MQQIANWLKSLGLGEYAQRFAENCIDASVLRDLTDQDLEKIGIPLGHRKKMLRAIAELGGVPLAQPQVVTGPDTQDAAERRHLTVMFCDLVGSTALSARLDPEDMHAVIAAYHAASAGIMPTYDGFIAELRGDGILTYFGYPRAHEDDAERAVRAGLDIVAAVARLKTRVAEPLAVRIGIATGLVVVGDLSGESVLREHMVVGDTPNLAARLQALAEPGTVVIAASTRRLLGDLFHLRDLGRHEVKGIAEPVAAWAVEGVSASESRFEAVRTARLTDLIGREHEIKFLVERQHLAWKGEGQIVLISGEPGIGKSRIAAALGERIAAEPHTRLRYQCSPYHTNSALYPFIAQLERAAGFKPNDTSERKLHKLEAILAMATSGVRAVAALFAALLSIPFGERYAPLALSPMQQRRQTFAALLDQLEGLARQKPVLWLFEDAHWADSTSRELIDLAVDRFRHLPVLAIITFRPEFEAPWAGLPNVGTLVLGRLDRSNVENMVARVTGGRSLPAVLMEQIVAKTDGNPLFVEELTKAVLEAGILVEDAEGYRLDGPLPTLAIPATLQDSLMARLDYLAPVKEIGQIGAAIGREFSYSLLRALLGRDETALKDALAQLEQAGLVFRRGEPPDAVYSFKHALVQDAAYEGLLKTRRRVLHRHIAETLRDRFPTIADTEPEVVAHHFTQAGLTETALEWWGKAGERAMQRSAYNEAIAHLEQALALANGLSDGPAQRRVRLQLQIAYGNALIWARGYQALDTMSAFARARELAADFEDAIERFSAYFGLWVASFTRAELTSAREVAEAFLRDADRRPQSSEAGIAHRVSGVTCWAEGNFIGARRHLDQALALYNPTRDRDLAFRFGEEPGIAASIRLATALWPLGEVDQARSRLEEAVSQAAQCGHIPTICYAHIWKCLFEAVRRDAGRARAHAEAVVGLSREHGLPVLLAAGTVLHRWARWRAGDPGAGAAGIRESNTIFNETGFRLFQPLFTALIAEAEASERQIDAALAVLNDQLVETERSGQRWYDAELHRLVGELLLQHQPADAGEAEAAFMRAIELTRSQQTRTFELRAALSLAKLYRTTGRDQAAHELLVPALVGFSDGPEVPEVEEARRLLTIHAALQPTALLGVSKSSP
jgi:class 3 adenylate cyclase/predicted ATPase